jgi:hypothetical protein
MEHNPFWEVNSTVKKLGALYDHEGLLPLSKEPVAGSYP